MWFFSARCESKTRLNNKTAIVTGCNTGIGKATVLDFVRRGARVVMLCRDLKKGEIAAEEIRNQTRHLPGAGLTVLVSLDLASLASVRTCAQYILDTEDSIHLLVNNAGVCYCPKSYTEDGFEKHMGVNHLGHFLLTHLLLPRIIRSAPARIINVSSLNSYFASGIYFDDLNWKNRSYSAFKAYSESKLANVLFTTELALLLKDTGVTTYALHPGIVATDAARYVDRTYFSGLRWFFENVMVLFCKIPEEGAQTTTHCAVDEEADKETGLFYMECRAVKTPKLVADKELARKLWEESVRLVGLRDNDPFKVSGGKC